MKKVIAPCFVLLIFSLFLLSFSCSRMEDEVLSDRKITVVATLFPLYDFAKHIAGDKAQVSLLVPPGVEAHSFEPKPGDLLRINKAGIFLYTGKYMEPWAEKIIKGTDNGKLIVVDTGKGINLMETKEEESAGDVPDHDKYTHGAYDPHIWLDLANAQKMIDNILAAFIEKDPLNRDYYSRNAGEYKLKLKALDEEYRKGLSQCRLNTFVHGGHFAFSYLARRYNLHYVSAYEGSPNAEPSPKRLAELENIIQTENIHYVFYEELVSPRIADVLAAETGVKLLRLHGLHNVGKNDLQRDVTYIDLMRENLKNLKTGLECGK